MISKEHLRKTQVKRDNEWVDSSLGQIEPGDIFRMFEADGTPVEGEWKALDNAKVNAERVDQS